MTPIKVRVHPHSPAHLSGPYDVKIGISRMPESLRNWDKKHPPLFQLFQPNQDDNFTMLYIWFGMEKPSGFEGGWHRANLWKIQKVDCPADTPPEVRATWTQMRPSHFTVNIKGRYISQLEHPMPVGQWEGTVEESADGVMFTVQALTLKLKQTEQKRTILLPGDEAFEQTLGN